MEYYSTRDSKIKLCGSQAILSGLSAEGGLFLPRDIPNLRSELSKLSQLKYWRLAHKIICGFFDEFANDKEFERQIDKAYQTFDNYERVVVRQVDKRLAYMELYHGSTCAFKDFALCVLPYEIAMAKKILGDTSVTTILTATSGDTGKAALQAFGNVDNFKVAALYPSKGVSAIQRLQMTTTPYDNTFAFGLEGNFDDAQRLVKKIFVEGIDGVTLGSANSINIGRLIPQIAYYFYTYFKLVKQAVIVDGQEVNFCVPTGNFGDILAGYFAKKMGLPIGKLICASNSNNVLTEFLSSGIYNAKRKFIVTTSPSMDILISSNLERLLALLYEDTDKVNRLMNGLSTSGSFDARDILFKLKDFVGGFASERQVKEEIKYIKDKYDYLIDTHTAVASVVARQYMTTNDEFTVVLSTASAYKFAPSVVKALDDRWDNADDFKTIERLSELTNTIAPSQLVELKNMAVVHNGQGDSEQAVKKIVEFCKK